jgi:signal transduction histidine kinase
MRRSRASLVTKAVVLTLGAASLLWLVLDRYHTHILEARLSDYLLQQIAEKAKEDRLSFDHYFRSHNEAARFILAQPHMAAYLQRVAADWQRPPTGQPSIQRGLPAWYPRPSAMRIFARPRFALLLDADGRVREVFQDGGEPLPAGLANPGHLLTKLSHTPGLMTEVDGRPFVLSADHRHGEDVTAASLILASPLDGEFLYDAATPGADRVVALLRDGAVVASNRPERVAPGLAVAALELDYVIAGKSFFDYGASDLALELATVIPRAQLQELRSSLLQDERLLRATTAAVLIGMFLGVIALVSRRLRQVTDRIQRFTRDTLGGEEGDSGERDELRNLMAQFHRFEDEIVRSHDAVRTAVAEQTRVQLEAEQQARVVNALQAVMEALGVGVISRGEPERPLNDVMVRYMAEVGAEPFRAATGEVHVGGADHRRRTFTVVEREVEGEPLALVRDVTDEHEAQFRLRLAWEVIDSAADGVFVLDAMGELELVNPAFWQMVRDIGADVAGPGEAMLTALTGDPDLARTAWDALHRNREWSGDFSVRSRQGPRHSYWLRLGAVSQETAGIHYFGILSDVTEAQRATERLHRYAEALEASNEELKRFAYVVSHDLRGPLVNIKGFAGELRMTFGELEPLLQGLLAGSDPALRDRLTHALWVDMPESLGFIDAGAKRMEKLIDAILDLSRLGRRELHPEPLDLGQLVEDCVRALQYQIDERHVQLSAEPMPSIVADRTALEQVVGNILQNAVNYLDPTRPGQVRVWASRLDQATVLQISDNGRGIRAVDREKVFTIFRRGHTDVPGEGMGLAYVQVLVRRFGGRIWFESEPGIGTTFSVLIPDTPSDQELPPEAAHVAKHHSAG